MRGLLSIMLLLLALETAFCSTYAPPPTEPQSKTVTVQTYYPEVYKKKKQKPLRRKMILVTPVHIENDDSGASKANSSEENPPLQSGDRFFANLSFKGYAGDSLHNWANLPDSWKSYLSPPDSPPPQRTI